MQQLELLRAANIARQAEWCPDQVPDLSFRGNELGGECGEAQNVIKKLERERHGWAGSRASVDHLAQELADVIICCDLVAQQVGIDLWQAVVAKFNATSVARGLATVMPATLPPTTPAALDLIRLGARAMRRSAEATCGNHAEGALEDAMTSAGLSDRDKLKLNAEANAAEAIRKDIRNTVEDSALGYASYMGDEGDRIALAAIGITSDWLYRRANGAPSQSEFTRSEKA